MNHQSLHQIKDFTELQHDARFIGLLLYLRDVRPRAKSTEAHGMIQDSGRLEEYLSLLDRIADAFVPPQKAKDVPQTHAYTNIPLSPENSKPA